MNIIILVQKENILVLRENNYLIIHNNIGVRNNFEARQLINVNIYVLYEKKSSMT